MAALIRHGSFASAFKSTSAILTAGTVTAALRRDVARHRSENRGEVGPAKEQKMVAKARISSAGESLAARGFLRPQKSYKPREDSAERIDAICESQAIPVNDDAKLEDPVLRFKLFVACEEELKYSIPNSLLYTIETVGDLKRFYSTPVDNTTPYEALGKIDLPKNLHILQNYHRFHPDTDTMFNGKTAFPKSSTLVTGLKYRKKYPGHTQESPWLDEQMKI
ncbi:39S ribosomal protein L50, mitochondrial isoform X1 [Solenopsis invicta]|uniref:39S ribosomal protein L50, mitochondrial isoform X1 n=1 Tax=Solenopsis invicta TaxID=13686 RepID=UPI000595D29E|nr:39S ribosomal protein L50, mitochondrial isoform X1 [Solenopsis invicta]